jgi:hypothetical protein
VLIEDIVRRYAFQQRGSDTSHVWQAGYFNDRDRGFHQTFDSHFELMLERFRDGEEPPIHARAGRRALALARASSHSRPGGARLYRRRL